MSRAVSGSARVPSSAAASGVVLLAGLVAAALYLGVPDAAVGRVGFVAVGLGSLAALIIGPRWHRTEHRLPWDLLALATLASLVSIAIRPWAREQSGVAALTADAFSLPAYGLMLAGLATFLSIRRGEKRHALIDGLLIGVGAALLALLLFSVPAAEVPGRPAAISGLAGLYPLLDAVLVLLVLNLAFTTTVRRPAYLLLIASMTMLLTGDVAYAFIGRTGEPVGSRLLNVPFLLSSVFITAAALHRTMRDLGRKARLPVQDWSVRRLLLIGPALAVPFVLTAVIGGSSTVNRVVLAVGGAAIVVLLLVRAVSAVRSFAEAQRRYEHQANHDHLTGLPNRQLFVDVVDRRLADATDPARPLWVYFVDLDGFKLVNDSWGHEVGDRVIVKAARRLRAILPEGATLARVGGDEFVIAWAGPEAAATALADRIVADARQPLHAPSAQVVVSASIGIARSAGPDGAAPPDDSAEALLRDADTAMYQAKSGGRNRWTRFAPSMRDSVQERIDVELALRDALGSAHLRLAYQPIVELDGGAPVGAEALIRWDHPERGAVPPAAFIPVAEETGLITDLGRWVLREAIGQLAAWRTARVVPDDFWISVNVSPRQLRDQRLPDELAAALAEHDVPGSAIILEITESVMLDVSADTDDAFGRLRELGVSLVVDDFGTGFSALGYLRRYPVTGVKVDRSFVGGLSTNPEDEEIVRAVVAMSNALGLTVVAEGVQTREQCAVLQSLGVVYAQGWLWDQPRPPAAFARRWGTGRPTLPRLAVTRVSGG